MPHFLREFPNRPDAHVYKALLVDGVSRDAKALTDWVLQPRTTYYHPHDDIVIGTTTDTAVFRALTEPIIETSSAQDTPPHPTPAVLVWTGIANPADFMAGESCNGWSDSTSLSTGRWGRPTVTDGSAFGTDVPFDCGGFNQFRLYCVEQP